MDPKDRLKTVAINAASAFKAQTLVPGGEKPTTGLLDPATVEAILSVWPAASANAAREMIGRYGPPNEAVPSRMIWYDNGPWKRTIAYRDEIPHNFPQPHSDVLEQVVAYRVPLEKVAELLRFDGSLVIERTAGEVAARCDMEAANVASLNLMHDIVTGRLTADEARREMAEIASAYVLNRPAPYTEGLRFEQPGEAEAKASDDSIIGKHMLHQIGEKAKDVLGGRD